MQIIHVINSINSLKSNNALFSETGEEKHQYVEKWDDYDMISNVEDKKFYVDSMILGFVSPVFYHIVI